MLAMATKKAEVLVDVANVDDEAGEGAQDLSGEVVQDQRTK